MKSHLAFFALAALVMPAVFAQPKISKVQNVFSAILPGMPNYGIAQGSIFTILGTGLATATSPPQSFPLPTVLNGASVSVTVNATTTHAILYFVSAPEILAILPSATPAGTGQITVTVNGKTNSPAGITVVQSAFGMLTLNAVGNGPAAVFDVNSQYLGLTNAANPGDVITLWGSGVGPVSGDETTVQPAQNLTDIPIEVDIGGKPATVQYAGRGYYPGLDVINVQVPAGVSGCKVSASSPFRGHCQQLRHNSSRHERARLFRAGRRADRQPDSDPVIATRYQPGTHRLCQRRRWLQRGCYFFALHQCSVRRETAARRCCIVWELHCLQLHQPKYGDAQSHQTGSLDAGPSIRFTTTGDTSAGNASMPFQNGGYSASSLPAANSFKGTYTFSGSGGADMELSGANHYARRRNVLHFFDTQ